MSFQLKHSLPILTLAAAALVGAPMAASAASDNATTVTPQSSAGWSGAQMHRGMSMHRMHQPFARLNLTKAQQDEIFKIRHDQEPAVYEQRQALRTAAKALRDVTRADAFDEGKAKNAAKAMGEAQGQLALLRAQTSAKIRAVLTPEQRAQLAQRRGGERAKK